MELHRYERWWIWIGALTMVALFATLVTLQIVQGLTPPSHIGTIDPASVARTPPFDHPGLRKLPDGSYDAYYVGRVFSWDPQEITIPKDAVVHFYVTSTDVMHGFEIVDTDVNVEVVPGWVSSATQTFTHRGTYLIVCNQYCGIGHQDMYAKVIVR
jgi:cytochrome c oxidase subunit 2